MPAFRPYPVAVVLSAGALALAGCDIVGLGNRTAQRVLDATVPEPLHSAYLKDANRLAVRHLLDEAGPAGREVEIAEEPVNELFTALALVHNATKLAARDSVVAYQIHTKYPPELRELTLSVDSLSPWLQAWRDGRRFTGNDRIDSLLVAYDLEFVSYRDLKFFQDAAWLRSPGPLNLEALAARFEKIGGVLEAHPSPTGGDGSDITASRAAAHWMLEYSLGFGDCPAGCISRHFWSFRVHPNGLVEFAGSGGPPPPAPR